MYYKQKLTEREGALAYSQLKKDVEKSGILDRDYVYYSIITTAVTTGFALSIAGLYFSQSLPGIVGFSIIFSFFAVQCAGIFHDAGHRAIFKSTKNNDIIGFIYAGLLAYTYSKWRVNHAKHHANPNEEEMDPDIERPMFSFNSKQLQQKKGLWRYVSKLQVYTYYPVGTLTGIYSQLANLVYLTREHKKTKTWEKLLYAAGISFWAISPLVVFDIQKAIIIYFTVYPLVGLYFFNIFAPNHKGMPQIKKSQKISFLEQQIVVSRNINGSFLIDTVLLGLNYQMEHHLFPHCPRNKLKLLSPYVKKICKKYGFEYTSVNLIESNKIILAELNQVATAG